MKDQYDYFKFGIDLMKNLHLLENLEKNGIAPNASAQYETTKLQDVLKKVYGHNATVQCASKKGQ
ncbi:unnamed protein product, partial [Schistosoma guineensis]